MAGCCTALGSIIHRLEAPVYEAIRDDVLHCLGTIVSATTGEPVPAPTIDDYHRGLVLIRPKRVLIVDDDPGFRESIAEIFAAAHDICVSVLQAVNGPTALDILETRRNEIDLAILDVRMPGMSGVEVLRRVRARGLSTRIVICTGQATIEELDEAVKFEVEFIRKPVAASEIISLVRSL